MRFSRNKCCKYQISNIVARDLVLPGGGGNNQARKMPLPGGLANAAVTAVWAVSTSIALLQPVDTSSSLLFQWLTCSRAVTKWLSRCIIAFLRDHRRRSLFVCDAPCLHASASRLAAFWTLVLINPASKTLQAANERLEIPSRGPPCYASPCRAQRLVV